MVSKEYRPELCCQYFLVLISGIIISSISIFPSSSSDIVTFTFLGKHSINPLGSRLGSHMVPSILSFGSIKPFDISIGFIDSVFILLSLGKPLFCIIVFFFVLLFIRVISFDV